MISACFYAQARIRKFTAKAACGPRSGQESSARSFMHSSRRGNYCWRPKGLASRRSPLARSGQGSPARLYTGTQRKKLCKMKNGVY